MLGLVTRGMLGGGSAADSTAPTVEITLPSAKSDPIVVTIGDETGLLDYRISFRAGDGYRFEIYNPTEGFLPPCSVTSTVSGAGTDADPYIFTLYNAAGWPTGIEIDVKAGAIDTGGNEDA